MFGILTLDHFFYALIGGVITVTVPKVAKFLTSKVVAPAETEIAKVKPAVSSGLSAELDKVVADAKVEISKAAAEANKL